MVSFSRVRIPADLQVHASSPNSFESGSLAPSLVKIIQASIRSFFILSLEIEASLRLVRFETKLIQTLPIREPIPLFPHDAFSNLFWIPDKAPLRIAMIRNRLHLDIQSLLLFREHHPSLFHSRCPLQLGSTHLPPSKQKEGSQLCCKSSILPTCSSALCS